MGKANPVALDSGLQFGSQGEATKFFSEMLARYEFSERVRAADEVHLRALIKRHTDYPQKFGPGVAYFFVDPPAPREFSTSRSKQCFWFCTTDGYKDDFSIGNCITQKAKG